MRFLNIIMKVQENSSDVAPVDVPDKHALLDVAVPHRVAQRPHRMPPHLLVLRLPRQANRKDLRIPVHLEVIRKSPRTWQKAMMTGRTMWRRSASL